jgi:LmbE family N-acetylglucosaminyl deacetylase
MPEERRRILVAMAHPDDVEYSCAAAVAQWVSEGCDVRYLVGTRGEAGMEEPEWTPERTAHIREVEQRCAADLVGAGWVEFLSYPDGRIAHSESLRRDLARVIRRVRPHRVVTLNYDLTVGTRHLNQADHRAFGLAVLDAVRDAASRWIFRELLNEGLEPWRGVQDVYVAATGDRDAVVSVSAEAVDRAVQALSAHESYIGDLDADSWVRVRAREVGQEVGCEYGVGFRVIEI